MSFVSANVLKAQREEKKEQKRLSRQKILEEAKEKFLEEKRRQELKRERGDDVWVAPGINKRLNLSKKKPKKEKKKKKSKEHVKDVAMSDDNSSETDEWVVKSEEPMETTPTVQTTTPTQRDEWMMLPLGPSLGAKKRLEELTNIDKEQEEEKETVSIDKPGRHPLELNPFWKDGGCGLPEDQKHDSPPCKVGDGGRSWLLRSYKRALERVETEGKSLEEIATHQWGSLDKLYSMLQDAGIDPKYPDKPFPDKKHLYSRSSESRSYERSSRRRDMSPPKRSSSKFLRPLPKEREKQGFMRPSDSDATNNSPSSTLLMSNIIESSSWKKKTISDNSRSPHSSPPRSPPPPTSKIESAPSSSLIPTPTSFLLPTPTSSSDPPGDAPVITNTQLNSLAAKIMKAELLGNQTKIDKLKKEMAALQKQKKLQDEQHDRSSRDTQHSSDEKVIVLTKTDRYGNTRPLERPSSPSSRPSFSKREPRGSTHTEKGKRKKYFVDDDQYSLKALVEQERLSTADETHAAIARMASKFVPSSIGDDTVDDALDSTSAMKHNPQKEEERAQRKAMAENRKMTEALENCKLCFENSCFDKHLLIAVGLNVYLSLPSVQSLTEGHCLIVPMEHVSSSLQVDENIWSEINIFRKGLTRMFSDRGMDVVFMEMSTRSRNHTVIECIPLPQEVGQLAPMYFKKAIQEGDREWSDNKKVIDTSKKGVRSSLPVGLPYFFVEFGTDGGYGHIVEDSTKFPYYFGKEVCGGMLDVEPRLWLKPHRESFERQKEKVIQFSEWWAPYDWTQKLKEEQATE